MSKVICIAGESGSGKTTSMRNLNPRETIYFDCDRKGLSWRNWKSQYNRNIGNYCKTSDASKILECMQNIDKTKLHIKTIVIDTLNTIMIDDEMKRAKEKGYDKWIDLASSVWDLVSWSHTFRDDLTVIFTAHTQTEMNDSGYIFTRIKTNGKKLDKIVLESKFTTVLLSKVVGGRYIFETKARNSTAKTPLGAFKDFEIENDIVKVIEALKDY